MENTCGLCHVVLQEDRRQPSSAVLTILIEGEWRTLQFCSLDHLGEWVVAEQKRRSSH